MSLLYRLFGAKLYEKNYKKYFKNFLPCYNFHIPELALTEVPFTKYQLNREICFMNIQVLTGEGWKQTKAVFK